MVDALARILLPILPGASSLTFRGYSPVERVWWLRHRKKTRQDRMAPESMPENRHMADIFNTLSETGMENNALTLSVLLTVLPSAGSVFCIDE